MDAKQNTTDWTPDQLKYMEWLALPKQLRKPKTVAQFAKSIGYDRTALWAWTKKPGWQAGVNRLSRENLASELPDIFGALAREAVGGNVQAIKLALEVLNEYTPKIDADITSAGLSIMQMKDLFQAIGKHERKTR